LNHILALFGKEADTPIEGCAQSGMRDRMTLVGPTTVVMEAQTKRAQGRGSGAHPFGGGSGSAPPSGFTRNAPWKS
jgi:hypothetical protein